MIFYNDLSSLPYYFLYLLGLLTILTCSIILHELGHIIVFWVYGIKTKVTFHKTKKGGYWETGTQQDYQKLTDGQYKKVVWVGILLGSTPSIIAAWLYPPNVLMLVVYGLGCISDIKNLELDLEDGF